MEEYKGAQSEPGWEQTSVSRRRMLNITFFGSMAAMAAGLMYPLVRYLMPSTGQQGGKKESFSVDLNELHVGEARFFTFMRHPAVMVRKSETEVVAMTAVCTHLGCIVKFHEQGQFLQCPCHGGKFDLSGKVIGGPPPKPLTLYAAKIEAGKVIVEEA